MNNSLRGEIALAFHEYAHPHALMSCKHLDYEQADQILSLIESKMPEKKRTMGVGQDVFLQEIGWNAYHDSVKSILRGTDGGRENLSSVPQVAETD